MKESDLNKKVQDLISSYGGYAVKVIHANRSGVHDMLACIPDKEGIGRFCSIEGKLDYNKMSTLQQLHCNQVIKAGGIVTECKSLFHVEEVIRMVVERELQKAIFSFQSFSL